MARVPLAMCRELVLQESRHCSVLLQMRGMLVLLRDVCLSSREIRDGLIVTWRGVAYTRTRK